MYAIRSYYEIGHDHTAAIRDRAQLIVGEVSMMIPEHLAGGMRGEERVRRCRGDVPEGAFPEMGSYNFV